MEIRALEKKCKGVTLIEMLAYLAALTALLTAIVLFTVNLIKNERILASKVATLDEADFAMRQVLDNVRLSKNIRADSGGTDNSLFKNSAVNPCATNCTLSLQKTGATSTVTFWVDGYNRLAMTEKGPAKTLLRELTSARVNVTKFMVTCVGPSPCGANPKSVQITIELADAAGPSFTQSITTAVISRGY